MYGNQNWQTTVYGVTTPYLYVKNYEINLIYKKCDLKNSQKKKIEEWCKETFKDVPEYKRRMPNWYSAEAFTKVGHSIYYFDKFLVSFD